MQPSDLDDWFMSAALALAARGRGFVEPNPLVGCIVAQGADQIGQGWHRRYGGPHAEIEALAMAGRRARGATLYVTLEPCCHQGKTPPCTDAIAAAGVARVVAAMRDPFPQVAGGGIARLEAAGIEVRLGVGQAEAARLNAPYLKLLATGRPWVIAKWAISLDGKLAARSGDSRWISGPGSREAAHRLRGQVDAVIVGRGTVAADDPLLTARPAGPRIAMRIVLDRRAALPLSSRLAATAGEAPVLVACGPEAPAAVVAALRQRGCEVLALPAAARVEQIGPLLDELGRRRMTNVLVEGGSEVLASFFEADEVDEVHVFIAPKLVGGERGLVAARPVERMADALELADPQVEVLGRDVHLWGRVARQPGRPS